jgi:hypothetical protein
MWQSLSVRSRCQVVFLTAFAILIANRSHADDLARFKVHEVGKLRVGLNFELSLEPIIGYLEGKNFDAYAFSRYSFLADREQLALVEVLGTIPTPKGPTPIATRLSLLGAKSLGDHGSYVIVVPAGGKQTEISLIRKYGDDEKAILEELDRSPAYIRIKGIIDLQNKFVPPVTARKLASLLRDKNITFATIDAADLFSVYNGRINDLRDVENVLANTNEDALVEIFEQGGAIPKYISEQLPKNIVGLTLKSPLTFDTASDAFMKKNGVTLDYYLFRLFAFALNCQVEDIRLIFRFVTPEDNRCTVTDVVDGSTYMKSKHMLGQSCKMMGIGSAVISQPAGNIVSQVQPNGSRALTVAAQSTSFDTLVDAFLRSNVFPSGSAIQFLGRGEDTADFIVRNLHNFVIKGGNYWERLQVSMVRLRGSTDDTIHVFVDGRTAKGIGHYPADSQFITGMEPAYSESLAQFSNQLAADFRKFALSYMSP